PERLLSVQNQQMVTDALAGSAPRGINNTEDLHLANLLLKNRKEKREHHAVRDFMIEGLRSIGLKAQQLPLQLLKLSNIQHLWTPIYAHLPADIQPLSIVELLHPTPAVAGVATNTACEKIRNYEKFNRSLYAAPLGWVDYEGNCEFIVGIRSALIDGDRATLYAGAGIVSGSNPDKEFDEIQLKLQSLLKALV
ncbi:MAG: isochorismate synthase, partial [Cyanobacteria bacterium J06638_38]